MKEETAIKITAIVCLTAFGITCITHGIDHAVTFTIATLIGGIAGYTLKEVKTDNVGNPRPNS
jgi:hypothetical protein